MIAMLAVALVFDAVLLRFVPWLLVLLLAVGVPLAVVVGVAMHIYPRRLFR